MELKFLLHSALAIFRPSMELNCKIMIAKQFMSCCHCLEHCALNPVLSSKPIAINLLFNTENYLILFPCLFIKCLFVNIDFLLYTQLLMFLLSVYQFSNFLLFFDFELTLVNTNRLTSVNQSAVMNRDGTFSVFHECKVVFL